MTPTKLSASWLARAQELESKELPALVAELRGMVKAMQQVPQLLLLKLARVEQLTPSVAADTAADAIQELADQHRTKLCMVRARITALRELEQELVDAIRDTEPLEPPVEQ